MVKKGKHFCDKKDCGIELTWAPGSFNKFNFEYQVTSNRRGFIFNLELCTNCEMELIEKVTSLMNKYYTASEIKYPKMIRN